MPAIINGSSMADLVKKQVELEVSQLHQLFLGALARITCLENELGNIKADRSSPRPPSTSTSSSQVCRHWLKRRCSWKEKCRFIHDSDADSEGSIDAKDQMGTRPTPSSSREVKLDITEDAKLLIDVKSNQPPPRPQSASGVLQSEPVGVALVRTGYDSNVKPHRGLHCAMVEDLIDDIIAKTVDKAAMQQQEEENHLNMVTAVNNTQAKYRAKYSPQKEGDTDIIHSAEVAIPRIDFAKVKPHLHRNLPKPSQHPVLACSPDPTFYTKCSVHSGQSPPYCGMNCKTLFECGPQQRSVFGSLPGFYTSLGVVAVPKDPIGGYVYAGGTGDTTVWQLHADAVYI